MRRRLGILVALATVFASTVSYGGTAPVHTDDVRDDLCMPNFPHPNDEDDQRAPKDKKIREQLGQLIQAKFYSYQVPILFRNEQTGQDYWTYARACIPMTLDEDGNQTRIGLGYSNVTIDDPSQPLESLLDFVGGGTRITYIPYALTPSTSPRVEAVEVIQSPVSVGISNNDMVDGLLEAPEGTVVNVGERMSVVAMLQLAGFFKERSRPTANYVNPPQAFWVEYSNYFPLREAFGETHQLQRVQFSKGWLNARYLICDPASSSMRPGVDLDFARDLMVREPAFSWNLVPSPQVSCNPLQDDDGNGKWNWGGGIGVFYLFPNLVLSAHHTWITGGRVKVEGTLVNQSSGAGPVYIYYRWGYDEPWKWAETETRIVPYQGHRADAAPGHPFSFEIPVPAGKMTLQVFAAPGGETGLAIIDPNPKPKDKEDNPIEPAVKLWDDPSDGRRLVTNLWNYTEFKISDNFSTLNLACGDLTISLIPSTEPSPSGFDLTATVTRDGCPDLTSATVDIEIDGIPQSETAYFSSNKATVSFVSGPVEPGSVHVQARVDLPDHVKETNEDNNRDIIVVAVNDPWEEVVAVCPADIPQEKCFSTIITR